MFKFRRWVQSLPTTKPQPKLYILNLVNVLVASADEICLEGCFNCATNAFLLKWTRGFTSYQDYIDINLVERVGKYVHVETLTRRHLFSVILGEDAKSRNTYWRIVEDSHKPMLMFGFFVRFDYRKSNAGCDIK